MSDFAINTCDTTIDLIEQTPLSDQVSTPSREAPTAYDICRSFSGPVITLSGFAVGTGLGLGLNDPLLGMAVNFSSLFLGLIVFRCQSALPAA